MNLTLLITATSHSLQLLPVGWCLKNKQPPYIYAWHPWCPIANLRAPFYTKNNYAQPNHGMGKTKVQYSAALENGHDYPQRTHTGLIVPNGYSPKP